MCVRMDTLVMETRAWVELPLWTRREGARTYVAGCGHASRQMYIVCPCPHALTRCLSPHSDRPVEPPHPAEPGPGAPWALPFSTAPVLATPPAPQPPRCRHWVGGACDEEARGQGTGWGTASCCRPRGRTAPARTPAPTAPSPAAGGSDACNGAPRHAVPAAPTVALAGQLRARPLALPAGSRPCAPAPCRGEAGQWSRRERWLSALAVQTTLSTLLQQSVSKRTGGEGCAAGGALRIGSPSCCRVCCPGCYRSRGRWKTTALEGPTGQVVGVRITRLCHACRLRATRPSLPAVRPSSGEPGSGSAPVSPA